MDDLLHRLKEERVAAGDVGAGRIFAAEAGIERECNANVARYQTIKKFELLPVAFSVDGGELTPTMKIKRNVVNEKYKDVIDGLYGE